MDFTKVTLAIADAEAQEKVFENAASANDTAQAALVNAQQTAEGASGGLNDAKAGLTAKLEVLKAAISEFESALGA